MSSNKLADFIRSRRNELGLSYKQVMERSRRGGQKGVSDGYIAKIETGRQDNPSASILAALARGLSVSESEILAAAGFNHPAPTPDRDPRLARLDFNYPKLHQETRLRVDVLLDAITKEIENAAELDE